MEKVKHTPWNFDPETGTINGANGAKIIGYVAGGGSPESLAHGYLMAAGPELLKLLESYIAGEYTDPVIGLIKQFDLDVKFAIEKARGE